MKITREDTENFDQYTVMMGAPNKQPAPMAEVISADSDNGVVVFFSRGTDGEIDPIAKGIPYECPVQIIAPGGQVATQAAPVSSNPRRSGGCCGG